MLLGRRIAMVSDQWRDNFNELGAVRVEEAMTVLSELGERLLPETEELIRRNFFYAGSQIVEACLLADRCSQLQ